MAEAHPDRAVQSSLPAHAALPRRWAWICLAVACAWSLLALLPVLSHAGWPANHDWTAPVMRMAVTLEQWKLGHAIPVWSTHLQYGYGSPLPALYHKTFTYLAATVLALTGSVKVSLVTSTFVFMVVGFCGMCFCLRQALRGRFPWLWMLGGALLVSSNYSTTDWLTRGAFAEFAAMALIPWVLAWCLVLIMDGRWRWWIGPLMALLVVSHSMLALYMLIPLTLALVAAVWCWRGAALVWWRSAATSIGVCVLCLAPFLLPMLAMGRFNRTEELVRHMGFTPMTQTIPLSTFFWHQPHWTWGVEWQPFTVQLDTALLLGACIYAVFLLLRKGLVPQDRATGFFLWATLACMAWLQTDSAFWFYTHVPVTIYLQFPWRLLAYLTAVLVLCTGLGLGQLASATYAPQPRQSRWARGLFPVLCVLVLGLTALPKMNSHLVKYPWISKQILQEETKSDYVAMAEFFPLITAEPYKDIGMVFKQMQDMIAAPQTHGCRTVRADAATGERTRGSWQLECPAPAVVALPVFAAPGMRVRVRQSGSLDWIWVPAQRSCEDPRLQLSLPAGPSDIDLRFPTWWSTVRAVFMRPAFDFRRDCRLPAAATRFAGEEKSPR